MIKEYEEAFILWLHSKLPELSDIKIGSPDLLTFSATKVVYPAALLTRELNEWVTSNVVQVFDYPKSANFYRAPQDYEGKIILERQSDALNLVSKLRFAWFKDPYVYIRFLETNLKVSLTLKYIKVESVRDNTSDKGPRREVQFAWKSELFFNENFDVSKYKGFSLIIDANNSNKLIIKEI